MADARERDRIRSIANALFGRISGRAFRAYSLVGHIGRVSGREYWNPVSAYPSDDGYVIPILYGRESQWVQNVIAAGSLRLRTKGREFVLDAAEIIPAARALPALPHWLRAVVRVQGVDDFLWAHEAGRVAGVPDARPRSQGRSDARTRLVALVYRRILNPVVRRLALRGLGTSGDQNVLRILRVHGRHSGRVHELPVRLAIRDGRRYVVSVVGDAEWVHNLRAAGTAGLRAGTDIELVAAREILGEEKAAFIRWYCELPDNRLSVRFGLGVSPGSVTKAQIERISREHPVFEFATQTGRGREDQEGDDNTGAHPDAEPGGDGRPAA
jgi:deazaflavin-dependent oxidoreductase (nitroreductase family)